MGKVGLTLAIMVGVVAVATASDARPPDTSVLVGEITALGADRADVVPVLRGMVEDEVGAIDKASLPRGVGPTVLSVSLVRMESRTTGDFARGAQAVQGPQGLDVSCEVSGALRSARHGAMFAVVEGRASAHGDARSAAALERATLRAAVSGAVSRVGDAMKRRR
jgi:hypothetical protein